MSNETARSSTVLVVEDDPILRMHAIDACEEAGFEVVDVGTAAEAVKVLTERLDIRIVFTDIDMPGSMDGLMLATLIRERWPPIEIIVTSGQRKPEEGGLPERGVFFPKPYSSEQLVSALRSFDRGF